MSGWNDAIEARFGTCPMCGEQMHLRIKHWCRELNGGVPNRKKAMCKKGHPLEGANLHVVSTTGARVCRACARVRERESKARSRNQRRTGDT